MSQRRSNGIRKLSSGRYQITFIDAANHKRRESFDREKDARAALDNRRTQVRDKEYAAPSEIPTVEQAARAWIERKKVSESKRGGPIKESTIEFWQNHIDRFIVPTIGPYKIDVVDTSLVEKQRDPWKALGLTSPSVNKVLTTLSAVFDDACRDKRIARRVGANPVKLAARLARGSNEMGTNDEQGLESVQVQPDEVYGPDQLFRLFEGAAPGLDRTVLMTIALTMTRHGEALGLMWRDVDFDTKELTIRRSWSGRYREDGEPRFWVPKTKHSVRKIHISDELVLALKKWKLQCPPSKWDLMFPQADGRPHPRKSVWRAMDRAVKKANENKKDSDKLRRLTVHSLRHSGASIHLMAGTPIPEVSAMLGHSNVNITLTVYAHFVPKMQTDSSARLASAIFSGSKAFGDQVGHLKDTYDEKTVNE